MTLNPNSPMLPEAGRLSPMAGGPPPMPGQGPGQGQASRLNNLDPVRVLRQHIRLLLVTLLVGAVLGTGIFFLWRVFLPDFRSEALLRIEGVLTNPFAMPGAGEGSQRMDYLEAQMMNVADRIKAQDIADATLQKDTVRRLDWFKKFNGDLYKAREALYDELVARPVRGSTQVLLAMTSTEEKDVSVILDNVLNVFIDKLQREDQSQGLGFRSTLQHEYDEADRELRLLLDKITAFQKENNVTALDTKNSEASYALKTLVEQKTQLDMAIDAAKASYDALKEQLQRGAGTLDSPEDRWEIEQMPQIANRDEIIRQLRENREMLLDKFGENHRLVVALDARMAATEQERDAEIDRLLRERQELKLQQSQKTVEQYQAQRDAIVPKLEEASTALQDLSGKIEEFKRMDDERARATDRKERADDRLRMQRMLESRSDALDVKVVYQATEPELYLPPPPYIVIPVTMVLAGLCVSGLLLLRELVDQRVKTPADVRVGPECELLGMLPDAAEDPSGNGDGRLEGVVLAHPTGLMAEAFRQVRTALLTRIDRRGYKTIMFVGAQAEAGVSCVMSNLAVSMAMNGRKVLIVDANLRRPAQHRIFEVPSQPGLVEVIEGSAELSDAIVRQEQPTLDILPVGSTKHAAPELLETPEFRGLLSRLETEYDLILLDAPPALLTSDSLQLAKEVDAVAIVVRAMREKRGMISRMFAQLSGHRADILGVVVNGVRSSAGGYFRKSYEQFYRYRHVDGKANNRRRIASKPAEATKS